LVFQVIRKKTYPPAVIRGYLEGGVPPPPSVKGGTTPPAFQHRDLLFAWSLRRKRGSPLRTLREVGACRSYERRGYPPGHPDLRGPLPPLAQRKWGVTPSVPCHIPGRSRTGHQVLRQPDPFQAGIIESPLAPGIYPDQVPGTVTRSSLHIGNPSPPAVERAYRVRIRQRSAGADDLDDERPVRPDADKKLFRNCTVSLLSGYTGLFILQK
jgi:hypothetical protein